MMKVGFDGTCLRQPRTGIGTYTYCLIKHIVSEDISINILDGARFRQITDYEHAYSATNDGSRPYLSSVSELARKSESLRFLYRRLTDLRYNSAVNTLDFFHATNYLPTRKVDIPTLPLIHDVSHLRHPEWHPKRRVEILTSRADEFSKAPLINTVSDFSAREIARTMDIPLERIRITPPGTNPLYFDEPAGAQSNLKDLDLAPAGYFLSVGALEPRKNLATIVSAYVQLQDRNRIETPLVIVGPTGWGDLNLPPETEGLRRSGHIRFLGYVGERVMHTLYAHAAAFLYPSLYEGFGMPITEAMATGTRPVVASGGAPEEVAGEDAHCAPARDQTAWQTAMAMALDEKWHSDTALRGRLKKRAGEFTWHRNAAQTLGIYHEFSAMI